MPADLDPARDLVLERHVDVAPEALWRAWTTPELIVRWFTPPPWRTVGCEIDLRPGGIFRVDMRGPAGEGTPMAGCWLEIAPYRRLVWTDALGPGFRPTAHPFMTAVIDFEPAGGGTRYTASARHVDAATRQRHEQMGFAQGWGTALDQLVAVAKDL